MIRCHVYFNLAFLLETEFLTALRTKGLRGLQRETRLLKLEFFPIAAAAVWIGTFFEARIPELRQRCFEAPACVVHLRQRSAWLWPLEPQPESNEFAFFDGADIQWREFRGALPLMLPAAVLLTLVVRCVLALSARVRGGVHSPAAAVSVRLLVGVGFVGFLHGSGLLFLAALLLAFFASGRALAGTRFAAPCAWLLALAAIAAKEGKWPVRRLLKFRYILGQDWAWLDAYRGEYEWESSVNLLVLKLLSFALDSHASAKELLAAGHAPSTIAWANHRQRYSLSRCVAHSFYAPLFIAGPTITFDDFADQLETPRAMTGEPLAWYGAQLAMAMLMLEVACCTVPCFALSRSGVLGTLEPSLGAPAVLGTLNIMWLKFLVIWRVARCWALADGIDPPENMRRCVNNHYSVASFWKSWHVSFNKWLVRYIYVPLGGKDRRVLATFATFLFVAYWHDVEAKLLAWGGLNALFIALESVATPALQKPILALGLPTRHPFLYRLLCAGGGAFVIILLMAGNMIGYSFGLSGAEALLGSAASPAARAEILGVAGFVFWCLSVGALIMFEVRDFDGTYAQGPKGKASPAIAVAADLSGKSQ